MKSTLQLALAGLVAFVLLALRALDQLTAWGAQHDCRTLLPCKARAFELASLSGDESVGVVEFLMSLDHPTPEIRRS